uniref:Phlebovirus glycoprotein G2 fusion domain-containing protein n=1 Tax=Panagrolaimus sp. PS1159 TaxID=55785 RepID=A0AC35GQQ7_9BILA
MLFIHVQGNAEFTAITAHSKSCTATANGFIDCTFKEASELFINSGTENGLFLKDNEEHPYGTVTISAEIQATCVPEKEHYTRIFKTEVSSSKRCRGAGPCSALTCAHTGPDDKIEGLGVANLLPGVTSCAESCGCWGCSCFICESGCLFYRYFAQPITKEAIRIFSCSTLTPTVVLNITLTTQEKTSSELMYLKNGETSTTMKMEVSLLNTFQNIQLNQLNMVQSESRTALLDKFSIAAADLLKCPSKEDAMKLQNCQVQQDLCYCHAADSVAKCNCNSNQILEQALKENSLPYRLPQGWLRKTQHGVTAIQEGRIQLKIALQDLQLSTVVDRNRCHATAFEVKGCSNCNSGALINITCKADFGTAMGHVHCPTFSFALKCAKRGTQQQIRIYSTSTQINE